MSKMSKKKIRTRKNLLRSMSGCAACSMEKDGKIDHGFVHTCPVSKPTPNTVDHPPHYNRHPSGVECITIVEHMTFNIGNAMKYLWRADHKGKIEDLEKAVWYIQREIQRIKKSPSAANMLIVGIIAGFAAMLIQNVLGKYLQVGL